MQEHLQLGACPLKTPSQMIVTCSLPHHPKPLSLFSTGLLQKAALQRSAMADPLQASSHAGFIRDVGARSHQGLLSSCVLQAVTADSGCLPVRAIPVPGCSGCVHHDQVHTVASSHEHNIWSGQHIVVTFAVCGSHMQGQCSRLQLQLGTHLYAFWCQCCE